MNSDFRHPNFSSKHFFTLVTWKCFGSCFQEDFESLFKEIDTDESGTISFRELMVFCKRKGLKLGYMEIVAFMKFFDKVIQFIELYYWCKSSLKLPLGHHPPTHSFLINSSIWSQMLSCYLVFDCICSKFPKFITLLQMFNSFELSLILFTNCGNNHILIIIF